MCDGEPDCENHEDELDCGDQGGGVEELSKFNKMDRNRSVFFYMCAV